MRRDATYKSSDKIAFQSLKNLDKFVFGQRAFFVVVVDIQEERVRRGNVKTIQPPKTFLNWV